MKARVKKTGQIIDVKSIGGISVRKTIQEFKSEDGDIFNENEIEFNDTIDWEERRFLIAKDVLAGFSQNNHPQIIDADSEMTARWAVSFADELIKQLKGE